MPHIADGRLEMLEHNFVQSREWSVWVSCTCDMYWCRLFF